MSAVMMTQHLYETVALCYSTHYDSRRATEKEKIRLRFEGKKAVI